MSWPLELENGYEQARVGLLQTADYARALFLGGLLNPSEDAIDQLVAARPARAGPEPGRGSARWSPEP